MSFTFRNSNGSTAAGSSASANVVVTGVVAGDMVCLGVSHEGTATTITVSDGTTTLTPDPAGIENNPGSSGEPHSCLFYLLASVASGTVTYTATFGAGRTFRNMAVMVFTPSAACSFEASNNNSASSGTSATSGNITTVGTDGLAFAYYADYGDTVSSEAINGQLDDREQLAGASASEMWSKTYAAGYTGQATATVGNTNRWNLHVMAFKIGGASFIPPPSKISGQAVKRAAYYRAYPHERFADLATGHRVKVYAEQDVPGAADAIKRLAA